MPEHENEMEEFRTGEDLPPVSLEMIKDKHTALLAKRDETIIANQEYHKLMTQLQILLTDYITEQYGKFSVETGDVVSGPDLSAFSSGDITEQTFELIDLNAGSEYTVDTPNIGYDEVTNTPSCTMTLFEHGTDQFGHPCIFHYHVPYELFNKHYTKVEQPATKAP